MRSTVSRPLASSVGADQAVISRLQQAQVSRIQGKFSYQRSRGGKYQRGEKVGESEHRKHGDGLAPGHGRRSAHCQCNSVKKVSVIAGVIAGA